MAEALVPDILKLLVRPWNSNQLVLHVYWRPDGSIHSVTWHNLCSARF